MNWKEKFYLSTSFVFFILGLLFTLLYYVVKKDMMITSSNSVFISSLSECQAIKDTSAPKSFKTVDEISLYCLENKKAAFDINTTTQKSTIYSQVSDTCQSSLIEKSSPKDLFVPKIIGIYDVLPPTTQANDLCFVFENQKTIHFYQCDIDEWKSICTYESDENITLSDITLVFNTKKSDTTKKISILVPPITDTFPLVLEIRSSNKSQTCPLPENFNFMPLPNAVLDKVSGFRMYFPKYPPYFAIIGISLLIGAILLLIPFFVSVYKNRSQ